MASSANQHFNLFTSLRYDPILEKSKENQILSWSTCGALYMPTHHRSRMLETTKHFGFENGVHLLEDEEAYEKCVMSAIEGHNSQLNKEQKPLRVKCIFTRTGKMDFEYSLVPQTSIDALYPPTLNLPAEEKEQAAEKPFEPSPLTGGALNMGPTDYKPVPEIPTQSKLKQGYKILLDSNPTTQSAHTILKTTYRPHYDASRARTLKGNSELIEEVLLYNPAGQITEGSLTTPYFYRSGRWVTPPVHNEGHGGQRGTTRRWALEKGICIEEAVNVDSIIDGEKVWISNGVRGFGWGYVKR